ncbi:hypothetical protein TNCV_4556361 [Trichonephila clavipes]|nr:hypothetical protein TNCV_4556361 [Trichonephila clavipes]
MKMDKIVSSFVAQDIFIKTLLQIPILISDKTGRITCFNKIQPPMETMAVPEVYSMRFGCFPILQNDCWSKRMPRIKTPPLYALQLEPSNQEGKLIRNVYKLTAQ